jgi:hypothetical protein
MMAMALAEADHCIFDCRRSAAEEKKKTIQSRHTAVDYRTTHTLVEVAHEVMVF